MTGGRVRRFMKNLVGYAMGDPWEGQQPPDSGDNPSGSGQGQAGYHTGGYHQPDHHHHEDGDQENQHSHIHPNQEQNWSGDGTPTSSTSHPHGYNPHENLSSFNYMRKPQDDQRKQENPAARAPNPGSTQAHFRSQHSPRSGEKHPRESTIPTTVNGPVLVETAGRNGGIQGFGWYANGLLKDGDGDVACSFLEESPKGLSCNAPFGRRGSGSVHPVTTGSAGWGTFGKAAAKEESQSAMMEVPKVKLRPMEFCPAVSCVGGNLAHALGPSREMVFA